MLFSTILLEELVPTAVVCAEGFVLLVWSA